MKKWEYKHFTPEEFKKLWRFKTNTTASAEITELGSYGWELCGFDSTLGVVFKRSIDGFKVSNPAHKKW